MSDAGSERRVKVGPYEVLDEIGRGASAVVWRARTPSGEVVALKLLTTPSAGDSLERFARERRLHAALGAEAGFVPLLDSGEADGRSFIVMPFLDGGSLAHRLRRGPLSVAETLRLGALLARAVGRAHARGVVHRDLKPLNILFDAGDRPFVADLGLAKHFRDDVPGASATARLSTPGAFRGTAGYMAPEQMSDAMSAGPPADVFALGVTLHECLTGAPAFPGQPLERMQRVLAGERARLDAQRTDVPPALAAVIARALATNPDERYADGAALASALDVCGAARPRASRRRLVVGMALSVILAGAGLVLVGVALRPAGSDASPGASVIPDRAALHVPAPAVEHGATAPLASSETALALAPSEALSLVQRAEARIAERRNTDDETERDASRAIELAPDLAAAWRLRAYARARAHRFDGAVADADRSIALAPRDAACWTVRSYVKYQVLDHEGAVADATQAIALDPLSAEAFSARGEARRKIGRKTEGLVDLTRAIELDPRNDRALRRCAAALEQDGQLREALRCYERALAVEGEGLYAASTRAHIERLRRTLESRR